MRAELLKGTLKALFPIQRTVIIVGPPGGGKTTIVNEVAKELDVPVILRNPALTPVEDFGAPDMLAQGKAFGYKMPDWFPYKGKPGTERGGILLFDDRTQASPDHQKAIAHICQARDLHGVPLADGWQVVSTGNRQADRAGATRTLSHLANRETTLEFETDLNDSTKWMLDNGVKPEVVSFLRFRPALLHDFDPQRVSNPTPRSWVEGISDILGVVPAEAEYECFKGAIGEGAAAEFVGFMRIFRKLPNPDAILMNPNTADVPTDLATLCALSGALSYRITDSNMERACQYAARMPAEFSVLMVSSAVRKNPDLCNTQAFTKWSIEHQDVLF